MESVAVIIPTYGQFDYAARAIRSAIEQSWGEVFIHVIDDHSPDWPKREILGNHLTWETFPGLLGEAMRAVPKGHITLTRFARNGGLTRSWNSGLQNARSIGAKYACATNSDVVFTHNWDLHLIQMLNKGWHLLGPVTNAPGTEEHQHVRNFFPLYRLNDDQNYLNQVALSLADKFEQGEPYEHSVNGFCMFARTDVWWQNAYDRENVFRPVNETDSKGRKNPTPLMTLNEYELQARWRSNGLKIGVCPSSFVFHYRAVSRGDKHKKGDWFRIGGRK